MKEINIPRSGENSNETILFDKSAVIVGANGSGKTRFGSKIEQQNSNTKRISAQRYLRLDEVVPKKDFESAFMQLNSNYRNQDPINPQDDYQIMLVSLFAQEARRNENVVAEIREKGNKNKDDLPKSAKEKVIEIWDFVFPHRTLKLDKDRVRAANSSSEFSGSEMSDGEKVGLYLISQVLLAETGCTFIIDEPELHLHKALMVRLWNKLEESRRDCFFIYITHDLDFATNKPVNRIIWIQGYNNNVWTWKFLEPNGVIPENLYLEILGSRKPILLVEGDRGSLDVQLYQAYYDQFTVIPRGSCDEVIESVKGLKLNENLHSVKVYGIIDKDSRSDKQLDALRESGIFDLGLNEIENLFIIPQIIDMVCNHLSKQSLKDGILEKIRASYQNEKEDLRFSVSKWRIIRLINEKFGKVKVKSEFFELKETIFAEVENIYSTLKLPEESAEIVEILSFYQNKGLLNMVERELDLKRNEYINIVMNFFFSEKKEELVGILRSFLPNIDNSQNNLQ